MIKREYFISHDSLTAISHDLNNGGYIEISPETRDENEIFLNALQDNYPDAYEALKKRFENHANKRFNMARQGLMCNFSINDNQPDLDENGILHPEFITCPIRNHCKLGFCKLKRRSDLTDLQLKYIKLASDGLSYQQIADNLCRSLHTVRTTFKKIYARLNFHGKTALANTIRYAAERQLI